MQASQSHLPKPEIMSPAGYWPQLLAAVEAGADAVYFGLKHFTARAKVGFGLDELPQVMATLHRRGVRGYVTVNTLVFDHELAAAADLLAAVAEAGADAIIVQDTAVARLARQIAPHLEVHGSTQMSITSAEGAELARQFGVSRVVLARELSLDDIRLIRSQTDCELEIFVHGALCVSYSGQCFSSEAWGGRSANRGQCAQACRLPYDLLVDGDLRSLDDARYLLSPGDLYALHQIPEIVPIGIHALKIEGRYKDENYVALTTRAYRQAVDEAWAGLPLSITAEEELQLEQVYSRGLGAFFIGGTDHQTVVQGRAPGHRGVHMGEVVRVTTRSAIVRLAPAAEIAPLKPGDGVVFDAAHRRSPEEPEEGGRIYEIRPAGKGFADLRFGNHALDFSRIQKGDLLWRTHDPLVDKAARPFTQAAAPVRKQPVNVAVTAREGAPLRLTWQPAARPDIRVTVESEMPLGAARKRPLDEAYLRAQLGRLGNSAYELAGLTLDRQGNPFAPSSLLNQLRRRAVDELAARQSMGAAGATRSPAQVLQEALTVAAPGAERARRPHAPAPVALHLLVRRPEQLDAALDLQPASITLDYLELYGLRPAVERIQAAGIPARVASPRILKPNEQRVVNFLLRLGCPVLVRSGGLLQALHAQMDAGQTEPLPLFGDFSLNAANVLSAQSYLDLGLERLTPTHDLNAAQVVDLARTVDPERLEVIVYQHLPVFHTEHCVFCRFLSTGTSYKDCGHPCERHSIALRDREGRAHPVMADVGCRNTVFGAQAQEASRHWDAWRAAGLRHMRLEFAQESGDQVAAMVEAFAATAAGRQSAAALGRALAELTPQGATEGSLFVPAGAMPIPLLD